VLVPEEYDDDDDDDNNNNTIIHRSSSREIEYTTDWMIFPVVFTASITTKQDIFHSPTMRNRTGSDLANFNATVRTFLSCNQMGDKMVSACA